MYHRPVRCLAILLACLSTTFVGAQTQQPLSPPNQQQQGKESSDPRHVLLPGGLDRGDAKEMLARKLRRTQDLQQTKDLVNDVIKDPEKYGMTEDDLAKWIKEYGKNGGNVDPDKLDPKTFDPSKIDPNDPKVQSLLDKIKDKDGSLTEDQKGSLKRMEDLWKNRQANSATGTTPTPPMPPTTIDPMTRDPLVNPPMPPEGPGSTSTAIRDLPKPPKPKESDGWWKSKSKEWMPKNDSSTIKKADAPSSEWSRKMREFSNNNVPKFNTKKMSDNTPTMRDGPRSSPRMPKVGMPSSGGGGGVGSAGSGLGTFLLVLFAIVVLGVVAFVVFRLLQNRKVGAGDDLAALGVVPVDPAHIRTRADLVRAFEYLALKLLGQPARNEHHLEIGEQLGTTPAESPQRREAAGELTHLYEQARYTPPEEELTSDELQAARHDLTLLGSTVVS